MNQGRDMFPHFPRSCLFAANAESPAGSTLNDFPAAESVQALNNLSSPGDLERAGPAMDRLVDAGRVDWCLGMWLASRHPRLTVLLTEGGWITQFPSYVRVFGELAQGREETLKNAGPDAVAPLVDAAALETDPVQVPAVRCLEGLRRQDAIDELCSIWAHIRWPMLEKLIVQRGYTAHRPVFVMVLSALLQARRDLVVEGGPRVIDHLIEALTDANPRIASQARSALHEFTDQPAIDAICLAWAQRDLDEVGNVIASARYVAARPAHVRVLSALKSDRLGELEPFGTHSVQALLDAATHRDPMVSGRALRALESLPETYEDATDALFEAFLRHDNSLALDRIRARGLLPRDLGKRALFFFLTDQWAQYEALDFDMSLLREAFHHGGKRLRSRISRHARKAARLELVELVAGVRHKRHMGEMTGREWGVTLGIVIQRQDWPTLWRLATSAPAVYAVQALRQLDAVGWQPEDPAEREGYSRLMGLAAQCTEDAPIFGVMDRPMESFQAHGRRVTGLVLCSYFERVLASVGWDGAVRTWRMPTGEGLAEFAAHRHPITGLAASADGTVLATGCGAEREVVLWDLQAGERAHILAGHVRGTGGLAMSPNGELLAVGCNDGRCHLWRIADPRVPETHWAGPGPVKCVAFDHGSQQVAAGSEAGMLTLWACRGPHPARRWQAHDGAIRAVAFSPDQSVVVSAGSDETLRLWSMPSGECVQVMRGHTNVVTSVAFSGDGKILASGSWDQTVRLWIVPDGTPWGVLHEHTAAVTCLATDPESRVLVSGGHDCRIVMWNFQSGIFRRPTVREDLCRLEALAHVPSGSAEETWLAFLTAQMKWRWRYDIEVETGPAVIEVGEFDIEVLA